MRAPAGDRAGDPPRAVLPAPAAAVLTATPARGRSLILAALVATLVAGCRTAQVPYPLERIEARTRATHARTIAVLPFVDDRRGPDRDGTEDVYVYRGVDHDTTTLAELGATPERAFAELLARHLVRAGVFARVVLVDQAKEAPEAELFLTAKIRRARGYVESEPRDDEALKRRKLAEAQRLDRSVLAEVWLADVTVYARAAPDRPLFRADVGWSIAEDRRAEPDEPDPWAVLGDALLVANGQAAALLAGADLSGAYTVEEVVSLDDAGTSSTARFDLDDLGDAAPSGWRAAPDTSTATPHGWRAQGTRCRARSLSALQTQRFHRVLGPYTPTVEVWWCEGGRLRYDPTVEFPALYAGRSPSGAHLFVHALGASNWPGAVTELGRFFAVTPPAARYTFEVGGPPGG